MASSKWAIIILLFTVSAVLSGCLSATSEYPKFLRSRYDFSLHINTNAFLHNATFYVPLPVKSGTPMVGPQTLAPRDFEQEGYTITFTQSPPGWNLDKPEEYQVPGSIPWFVVIHTDLWPNDSYEVEIHTGPHDHTSPDLFANTLLPVGNESIILPKFDFSPPQPIRKSQGNSSEGWIEYTNISSKQRTWIYADYSTGSDTVMTVYLLVQGSNYWLDNYDRSIGNNYQDYFNEVLSGEYHGGRYISGEFIAGNMIYPDLSSSKWQQFIQKNKSSNQ